MSGPEFILQGILAVLAISIGWVARGLCNQLKARMERRAWKHSRRFLSSKTSKS